MSPCKTAVGNSKTMKMRFGLRMGMGMMLLLTPNADDASTTTAMQLHIMPPKAIDFQEKQDHDS